MNPYQILSRIREYYPSVSKICLVSPKTDTTSPNMLVITMENGHELFTYWGLMAMPKEEFLKDGLLLNSQVPQIELACQRVYSERIYDYLTEIINALEENVPYSIGDTPEEADLYFRAHAELSKYKKQREQAAKFKADAIDDAVLRLRKKRKEIESLEVFDEPYYKGEYWFNQWMNHALANILNLESKGYQVKDMGEVFLVTGKNGFVHYEKWETLGVSNTKVFNMLIELEPLDMSVVRTYFKKLVADKKEMNKELNQMSKKEFGYVEGVDHDTAVREAMEHIAKIEDTRLRIFDNLQIINIVLKYFQNYDRVVYNLWKLFYECEYDFIKKKRDLVLLYLDDELEEFVLLADLAESEIEQAKHIPEMVENQISIVERVLDETVAAYKGYSVEEFNKAVHDLPHLGWRMMRYRQGEHFDVRPSVKDHYRKYKKFSML